MRLIRLTSIAGSFLLALTLPSTSVARTTVNSLAAVVNGQVVTQSEVDEAVKHTRDMIMATVPPGAQRTKQLKSLREEALDSLIERELILAEFAKLGGSIKDEIVEEDINKIIQGERFNGNRQKFLDELKKTGMTLKRFQDLRRKILIVEIMRSRQGGSVPFVTPAQIQDAYAKHGDKFRGEAFIRLRTLMLPKITGEAGVTEADQRAKMKSIRQKILTGADFAQMAIAYSQDSVSDKGGDRGTIGESSIELRRDLKEAAFRLGSGQMSEVLEDPYAFYLLKVDVKKPGAKKPLSDKEVRDACEKLAMLDLRKEAHERWVTKLKRTASVRRFDSNGRAIAYTPPPSTTATSSPRWTPTSGTTKTTKSTTAPKPDPKPAGSNVITETSAAANPVPEERKGFGSRLPKLPKIKRPGKLFKKEG